MEKAGWWKWQGKRSGVKESVDREYVTKPTKREG
jgi:hypothetical protein